MLLVLLTAVLGIATVGAIYECRRDSDTLCEFGTCNSLTGDCENCQMGYEGYDCSVETNKKDDRCPPGQCDNGGTCHDRICLCPEPWTGARCRQRRYDLSCNYDAEKMEMTLRPHIDNFAGKIYIKNKETKAKCNFNKNGNRYRLSLFHTDGDCGNAVIEGTQRKRYVIIQFKPTRTTLHDEFVEFICGVSDVLEDLTFEITVGEITGALIPVTKSLSALVEDIEMSITLGESEEEVSAVNVNTQLFVHFVLSEDGETKFNSIRLENCIASNLPAGSGGYKEAKFIENSCPHTDLDDVMSPNIYNGGNEGGFNFYAFKFLNYDNLYITCDVKTCEETSGCEAVSCEEVVEERRKRESGLEPPKTVQGMIRVNDPASFGFSVLREDGQGEMVACYQTREMRVTLVALAVALGIALLVCVVIGIVRIFGRNKSDE